MVDDNEKAPDFSDVQSGSSSTAPAPDGTPPEKVYVVQRGDSLSKIAKNEYGDVNKWKLIFEANKDQIKNPDLIQPGQTLKIPAEE
jgi:nucleoid-associated protein YgaU